MPLLFYGSITKQTDFRTELWAFDIAAKHSLLFDNSIIEEKGGGTRFLRGGSPTLLYLFRCAVEELNPTGPTGGTK